MSLGMVAIPALNQAEWGFEFGSFMPLTSASDSPSWIQGLSGREKRQRHLISLIFVYGIKVLVLKGKTFRMGYRCVNISV